MITVKVKPDLSLKVIGIRDKRYWWSDPGAKVSIDSGAKMRCRLSWFLSQLADETITDRLAKGISWPMGLLRLVSPIFPAHLLISPWPLYTYIFHLCIHGPAHAPDYRVGSHLFCIERSEIKIAYNCLFDVRKYSRPCATFATRFCVSDVPHRATDSSNMSDVTWTYIRLIVISLAISVIKIK